MRCAMGCDFFGASCAQRARWAAIFGVASLAAARARVLRRRGEGVVGALLSRRRHIFRCCLVASAKSGEDAVRVAATSIIGPAVAVKDILDLPLCRPSRPSEECRRLEGRSFPHHKKKPQAAKQPPENRPPPRRETGLFPRESSDACTSSDAANRKYQTKEFERAIRPRA